MIKVGVTGGIGSGKSMVCRVFESLGVPVYSADQAARSLVDSHKDIRDRLMALLGDEIYDGYTLNRPRMASIIFHNKHLLEDANRIIHPRVLEDFDRWARIHEDKDYVIEEAAILFESGASKLVDRVVTVVAPVKERVIRVIRGKKLSREQIMERIRNQMNDESKIKLSDYVIHNSENDMIIPAILRIHEDILNHLNS